MFAALVLTLKTKLVPTFLGLVVSTKLSVPFPTSGNLQFNTEKKSFKIVVMDFFCNRRQISLESMKTKLAGNFNVIELLASTKLFLSKSPLF